MEDVLTITVGNRLFVMTRTFVFWCHLLDGSAHSLPVEHFRSMLEQIITERETC